MDKGVDENEFLDCNEQDSYIYGTTFSSVREVMSENKLCVIDCRPEALKMLHNSHEFLPFVIYLKAPAIVEDPEAIIEENGSNGEKEINGESESKEEKTLIQSTNISVPIDPQ